MPSRPLSSTPALWRLPYGHFSESDARNQELRRTILQRDHNTCVDCGLSLARHMEVRHLDDDHENHADTNLVCVCPFCHLRDHLGPTGFATAGLMIGAPSLTQGQVNHLALSCWYVQSRVESKLDIRHGPELDGADPEAAFQQRLLVQAKSLLRDLETKGVRWGDAYSALLPEPDVLGGVLNELSQSAPEQYARRDEILAGVHILPLFDAFETQCADWFAEFDRTRPLPSWRKGMETLLGRAEMDPTSFYTAYSKSVSAARGATPIATPAPTQPPALPPEPPIVGSRYAD